MPRPRKTQPPTSPITARETSAPAPSVVALIAPPTRTLIRAVGDDDRDTALEIAERWANNNMAELERGGAAVLGVTTQALYLERHTHWQVIITIVYRGGEE